MGLNDLRADLEAGLTTVGDLIDQLGALNADDAFVYVRFRDPEGGSGYYEAPLRDVKAWSNPSMFVAKHRVHLIARPHEES